MAGKIDKMKDTIARTICPHCQMPLDINAIEKIVLPFCTKRCKMADLGKWLGEKYLVKGEAQAIGMNKMEDE